MTKFPASMVGRLSHVRFVRDAWSRRVIIVGLLILCALFTLFPQKHRVAMSLTPTDPSSLGLGMASSMSQFGALSGVFGSQSTVEVAVKVASSTYARTKVDQRLHLESRLGLSRIEVLRWLDRKVDIRSLRGGIMQFEIKLRDAEMGREIIAAYGDAVREELAVVNRGQSGDKRDILFGLIKDSSDRLAVAQNAYDSFRLRTRYSEPQAAISAIGERIPMFESMIKSKQVELSAQHEFGTDRNMKVRQTLAEIASLQKQLDDARSLSPDKQSSVGRVVQQSTEADKLRRNLEIAQRFYDTYSRQLEGMPAEDLASTANVRVLEPAYIDPARQYNYGPLALGVIILLIGIAIEGYQLRPPVGNERLA